MARLNILQTEEFRLDKGRSADSKHWHKLCRILLEKLFLIKRIADSGTKNALVLTQVIKADNSGQGTEHQYRQMKILIRKLLANKIEER
jgi:hypothetical protein